MLLVLEQVMGKLWVIIKAWLEDGATLGQDHYSRVRLKNDQSELKRRAGTLNLEPGSKAIEHPIKGLSQREAYRGALSTLALSNQLASTKKRLDEMFGKLPSQIARKVQTHGATTGIRNYRREA